MTPKIQSWLLLAIHKEYPDIDLSVFLNSKENRKEILINVKRIQEEFKNKPIEEPKKEPSAASLMKEISERVFNI